MNEPERSPATGNWSIRSVLAWMESDFRKRGLDSPRLDAELLLADALAHDRVRLYMELDKPLAPAELTRVREHVERRRDHEPVAYILGYREFYGRRFEVSREVLVPRPDTETLVDAVLAGLPSNDGGPLLDLCTGSGIVGLTLAVERPNLCVTLTDISSGAVSVAKRNAERLKVSERASVVVGDLFERIDSQTRFLIITCNPPYIVEGAIDSMARDIRDHEPRLALAGGADGLDFYRRISARAADHLKPAGRLFLEIGVGQRRSVQGIFEADGFKLVAVHHDLATIERVVEFQPAHTATS